MTFMATLQAVNYDKSSTFQQSTGTSVIEELTLETGSSVLDLGCGTGYLTKVLSERVGAEGKVVAVDPDGERLKIAREKHSARNIEYIQADDKTFPSGQYDVIFSNIVIHWIKDKEGLFSRVHQNLCPGGRFVFTTFDGEQTFPPIAQKIFNLISPDFYHKMLYEKQVFLTRSEYQCMASEAGFHQVSIDVEDVVNIEWKNLDAFIIAMNGVFHGQFDLAKMDSDALGKLIEDYGKDTVLKRPTRIIKAVLTK